MLYKHFTGQVKEVTEGKGSAIFATLNVIDKDGDVTTPGAFGEQKAKLSPAHDWSAPGMGIAHIRESGEDVIADFEFNLKMHLGQEWAESLRYNAEKGIDQEWSYGFDVLEEGKEQRDGRSVRMLKRLKVYEVSPVMVGAGMGTRTVSMKSSRKLEDHFADVVAEARDFATRLADLKSKRAQNGQSLSRVNCDRLKQAISELEEVLRIADDPEPSQALLAELVQFDLNRVLSEREQYADQRTG